MIDDLTPEEALKWWDYNQTTGEILWKRSPGRSVQVGDHAGSKTAEGYIEIRFRGRCRKAHRLAWLVVYGAWPETQIDHVNGVRDDNRIANLRLATPACNRRNSRRPNTNTSGFKGASLDTTSGKWRARIGVLGKIVNFGSFESPNDAHAAYCKAANELHGEFANHGLLPGEGE